MAKAVRLNRNIPLLFGIQVTRWFLMVMPIIVVYFQDNGLSLTEVMIVQAAFSISMFVFEIPSGYFSDKIGRKLTLIIGLSLSAVGMFTFGIIPNFWGFILAEALLGLGASFVSGTDSSLLYDSLIILDNTEKHHKLESQFLAIGNFTEAAAGIVGGVIAVYSMRNTFFLEASVLASGVILAAFLIEPNIEREGKQALSLSHFLSEVAEILRNRTTRYLIFFGAFAGLATFLAVWYVQPVLQANNIPIAYFGIIWAVLNLIVGLSSLIAHRFNLHKNIRNLLYLLPFALSLTYFLLPLYSGIFVLFGFLWFYIIRGIQGPFMRNLIHKTSRSGNRATILSTQSLVHRLAFTFLGPLFAFIADTRSINHTFIAIGIFFFVLSLLNALYLKSKYSIKIEY